VGLIRINDSLLLGTQSQQQLVIHFTRVKLCFEGGMTENFVQSMLPLCLRQLCVRVQLDGGKRKLTIFIHILIDCLFEVLVHTCYHHRDWEMVSDPFIRNRFQSQDNIVHVSLWHHIRSFHPV